MNLHKAYNEIFGCGKTLEFHLIFNLLFGSKKNWSFAEHSDNLNCLMFEFLPNITHKLSDSTYTTVYNKILE